MNGEGEILYSRDDGFDLEKRVNRLGLVIERCNVVDLDSEGDFHAVPFRGIFLTNNSDFGKTVLKEGGSNDLLSVVEGNDGELIDITKG